MTTVYLNGQAVRLDRLPEVGEGGEAVVYDLRNGKFLKWFKPPTHPSYESLNAEETRRNREGARLRLIEHQLKLPAFPKGLPKRVIVPEELVTDRSGREIVGYTMQGLTGVDPLRRYAKDKEFRDQGVDNNRVLAVLRDLHQLVSGVHDANAVIGDFNWLNVLVGNDVFLIDADSFQFGPFLSKTFTTDFVDPLLCDPSATGAVLAKPYVASADWYAFSVMLLECLLRVHPYGGVYRPRDNARKVSPGVRSLRGISVFRDDVIYPKPAVPLNRAPDELLHYLEAVFERKKREVFPQKLLEHRWTTCTQCGTAHGRALCPNCSTASPAVVRETITVRGTVTATKLFQTRYGVIVFACHQGGKLQWLYHEDGEFRRLAEQERHPQAVMQGGLDPHLRFRFRGKATLIGKDGRVVVLDPTNQDRKVLSVDSYGPFPIFDSNSQAVYWPEAGLLKREGELASEVVGSVSEHRTLIWVGEVFGFGFYRTSGLTVGFVFDVQSRGINDAVKIPAINGRLLDATCVFASDRVWVFLAIDEGGRTVHRCHVIIRKGEVIASGEAEEGDGTWLTSLRGKCAVGSFLFSATDEGVVRVEVDGHRLTVTKQFPDTEPFVDSQVQLFAGAGGLYVVRKREIFNLKISK